MTTPARRTLTDCFYDALAVSQTASAEEISDAERALLKAYEQRAHLGDAEATDVMRKLNEAHAALIEPHKRADYDRRAATRWHAFADVAHSPAVERFEKLRAANAWGRGGRSVVREATYLDRDLPMDLLRPHVLLGDREK